MKSPGITVRPIQLVDGGHEVNEVFFDDVRVPVENLVGEENRGWDCAKFLLANERSGIARVGTSKARLRRIRELARTVKLNGGTMWDSEQFRHKVAAVEIELKALEMTQLRVIANERARGGMPGPGVLHPENQGLGNSAAHQRADAGTGGAVCVAVPRSGGGAAGGDQRLYARVRVGGCGGADVFQ